MCFFYQINLTIITSEIIHVIKIIAFYVILCYCNINSDENVKEYVQRRLPGQF